MYENRAESMMKKDSKVEEEGEGFCVGQLAIPASSCHRIIEDSWVRSPNKRVPVWRGWDRLMRENRDELDMGDEEVKSTAVLYRSCYGCTLGRNQAVTVGIRLRRAADAAVVQLDIPLLHIHALWPPSS